MIQLSEWKTPPQKNGRFHRLGSRELSASLFMEQLRHGYKREWCPQGSPHHGDPIWRAGKASLAKIPWGEDERTHTTPPLTSRPLRLPVSQGARNVHTESPLGFQNNSVSPSESLRASEKHRGSADYSMEAKKRKAEEKDSLSRYVRLVGAMRLGLGAGAWEHLQA